MDNKAIVASRELKAIDELAVLKSPVHDLSALSKLFLTILYIAIVVSFNKYDFLGLFVLVLFPLLGYSASTISVSTCFRKLRIVLPLVLLVGVLNPFFDKVVLFQVGNVGVTGGVVSMVTLLMKGIFSLMASFLLIATTPIEEICSGLRVIRFPRILVTLILLTYRYIGVMLDEVGIMINSYSLRAPGQKGIHYSAWGSFIGQLILRSMDKATMLYESMLLRGFQGVFDYRITKSKNRYSWIIALILAALIVVCRIINVPVFIGSLFV